MRIAIVGYGYVGSNMAELLSPFHDLSVYDPIHQPDRSAVMGADLAIICVPTPEGPDGGADVSAVEEAVAYLDAPLILIKSTVPPGTTDRVADRYRKAVHFSPEYLVERDPSLSPEGWVLIGGPKAWEVARILTSAYAGTRIGCVRAVEAELAKYMGNAFLATKVTFCNEFAGIASAFGVDYDALRSLWLMDPRMGESHTQVFEGNPGFGGKCLPKDLSAIIAAAENQGAPAQLLHAVRKVNDRLQERTAT